MADSQTTTDLDLGTGTGTARIVVPITLDHRFDRGASLAARLAERWNFPLHLVSADTGGRGAVDLDAGARLEGARKALSSAHPGLTVTDEMIASLRNAPAALAAALTPSDLVVMATEADRSKNWPSFAQSLASVWGGPIMLVGPRASIEVPAGDVVLGLDGSTLAEQAIPVATGLAAALGVHLWVVQVVSPVVGRQVERLRARGEHVSENRYIQDVVARIASPRASWEIVHGADPARSLTAFAHDRDVSLLVMATHGASGIPRQVFGGTCLAVVSQSTLPVVVISGRPIGSEPALL